MTKQERALLQHAMQVLGPRATCKCDGCRWEMNETLRMLRACGIRYKGRKLRGPKHDRAAERRGNEPSIVLLPVMRRRGKIVVDTARLPRLLK